jgi:hypothetical protein
MTSTKDLLHKAIDLLDEEESLQTLEFIRIMQRGPVKSLTLKRLINDPAFNVPMPSPNPFDLVRPMPNVGKSVSQLIFEAYP